MSDRHTSGISGVVCLGDWARGGGHMRGQCSRHPESQRHSLSAEGISGDTERGAYPL